MCLEAESCKKLSFGKRSDQTWLRFLVCCTIFCTSANRRSAFTKHLHSYFNSLLTQSGWFTRKGTKEAPQCELLHHWKSVHPSCDGSRLLCWPPPYWTELEVSRLSHSYRERFYWRTSDEIWNKQNTPQAVIEPDLKQAWFLLRSNNCTAIIPTTKTSDVLNQ